MIIKIVISCCLYDKHQEQVTKAHTDALLETKQDLRAAKEESKIAQAKLQHIDASVKSLCQHVKYVVCELSKSVEAHVKLESSTQLAVESLEKEFKNIREKVERCIAGQDANVEVWDTKINNISLQSTEVVNAMMSLEKRVVHNFVSCQFLSNLIASLFSINKHIFRTSNTFLLK
jgi:autonomous glycyl radical cofactor GrcA